MSGILSAFIGRVAGVVTDAYFNLVTLLLPGNGTNGAQNNTFLDSSTNNFSITRNGNTTQGTFSPFSQTGWSNYFDGTDDYLAIADNAVLRPGAGAFTLEAWIYRAASGAAHTIYAKGGASTGIVFQVTSTNVLRFTHTTTNIDSTGTIAADSWVHVAVVREGTGTNQTKLYINGTQDGQGTVSTDFTQTEEVRIGTDRSAAADFNGYISNLRFTKGAALYTGNFTPATSPLTTTSQGASSADVELLTCQSNRFIDNSSNAFPITVTGTPSVQAFSPFAPTAAYSAATVGGSGYFDGTGDYLNSTITAFGSGNFTIECWVYFTASVASKGIFHVATSSALPGTVSGVALASGSSGGWTFYYNNGSQNTTTTLTAAQNTWIHLAVVKSGTTIRVYVDGVMNQSQTDTANYTSQVAAIGGFFSTAYLLTGYISGFKVTSTADYSGTSTTTANFTLPTAPPSPIGSILCCNFTNAGITDATAKNDLETVGNAQISTTQSKFGGSSMYFDGTGDYLVPINALPFAFGTGDFTVEFWYYSNNTGVQQIVYDSRPGVEGAYLVIYKQTGNVFSVYVNSAARITGTVNIAANTWYHIAVCRSGTSTRLFVNGTQDGSTYSDSTSYLNTASRPVIGAGGAATIGTDPVNGYIDDLRVTRFARYTANFTAPTAALPLQ